MHTKGGLTILFDGDTPSFTTGGVNNSRVTFHNGPTFLLAASRIIDTAGNFIQFEYNQADGDYDIARAYYTAHGTLSSNGVVSVDRKPFAVVNFEYEAAPRSIDSYVAGFIYTRKTRLKSIVSLATSDLSLPVALWSQAARYLLDYEDRPTTSNRFVLTSVTQYGEDGSEIEPTRFTYSEPAIGWKDAPFALPVGAAFAARYQLAGAYKFSRFTDSVRTSQTCFSPPRLTAAWKHSPTKTMRARGAKPQVDSDLHFPLRIRRAQISAPCSLISMEMASPISFKATNQKTEGQSVAHTWPIATVGQRPMPTCFLST